MSKNKKDMTTILGITILLFAFIMAFWKVAGSPVKVDAEYVDPQLEALELSLLGHSQAKEQALHLYYNEAVAECYAWKATFYYKQDHGIELQNPMTESEVNSINCNAVGF